MDAGGSYPITKLDFLSPPRIFFGRLISDSSSARLSLPIVSGTILDREIRGRAVSFAGLHGRGCSSLDGTDTTGAPAGSAITESTGHRGPVVVAVLIDFHIDLLDRGVVTARAYPRLTGENG